MSDQIKCHEALEVLYEYLDGELTADTAAEVHRHIEICQRCYPQARFTAEFRDALHRAALGQPVCPDSLRRKVRDVLASAGAE